MKEENSIEVRNLEKTFKVYPDKSNSIKEKLLFWNRNKYEKNNVLNGISFDIKKGEAVGLIGRNGCGKSTTLKLLNRIMYPTSGSIKVRGKVSSLIELGAGFHPDMTGYENIYINASIFGLTKKQIDSKLDDIVEFSELGDAIYNPVRTYSSGMYMRLAFSVAINVEADVLLIDEILAVGDVNFQNKCFDKLRDIKYSGTTIVIVSHSMEQINRICDKCIWISRGKVVKEGDPKLIQNEYIKAMQEEREKNSENGNDTGDPEMFCGRHVIRTGTGELRFTDVSVFDSRGNEESVFNTGDLIRLKYGINSSEGSIPKDCIFSLKVYKDDGTYIYGTDTTEEKITVKEGNGAHYLEITFPSVPLLEGNYYFDIEAGSHDRKIYDSIHDTVRIWIQDSSSREGTVVMDSRWSLG